jgi:chromatin remodeling complex protein RSC6
MAKRTENKKPAFGGYAISFQGRSDSLESLFGTTPIGPAEMTKKLWSYVKRRGLATKP